MNFIIERTSSTSVLVISFILIFSVSSCSDHEKEANNTELMEGDIMETIYDVMSANTTNTLLLKAKIIEVINMSSEPEWPGILFVLKCVITQTLEDSSINALDSMKPQAGWDINIVVADKNVLRMDVGFIDSKRPSEYYNDTYFQIGKIYKFTLTEGITPEFESVRKWIEDLRMGLLPCLRAERYLYSEDKKKN